MLNEKARKWVKKLRTPGLCQIQGMLETQDGQCCLGVACELYAETHPDFPIKKKQEKYDNDYVLMYGAGEHDMILPQEVQAWLGLKTDTGTFTVVNEQGGEVPDSLAARNDNGASFAEIAELIEEMDDVLFVVPDQLSKEA